MLWLMSARGVNERMKVSDEFWGQNVVVTVAWLK